MCTRTISGIGNDMQLYYVVPYPFHQVDTLNPLNILKTSVPRDYAAIGSVDPCVDFYKFVCSTFRGVDEFTNLQKDIEYTIFMNLSDPDIPPSNQLAWQKAGAMYQACLSFVSSNVTETKYLVEWMVSLNLDLTNEGRLATVNPVEMMVRGSLDIGVHVVIAITFDQTQLVANKKPIQIEYSFEQQLWLGRDLSVHDYVLLLEKYGVRQPLRNQLASKIKDYEKELKTAEIEALAVPTHPENIPISKLGSYTTPFVTEGQMAGFFSTYTKGTYTASDTITHVPASTSILLKMLKNNAAGANGLRYLVAWSFYRQLLYHTEPQSLLNDKSATIACFEHIRRTMKLAVISPYFIQRVTPRVVYQTERMTSRIRSAFEKAIQSSSWVGADVRYRAINRLTNVTVFVGSPGRRLDPKFVEEVYRPYPDAPRDRLFPRVD
ncbi:hypothetical protein MTO96_003878 [Rhipicephalus appendiculatus]